MGWLAYAGNASAEELRRAMIYGSATGSLVCEKMGVDRMRELDVEEIHERVREFRRMTTFDHPRVSAHG
jgi:hypothetical protein